jgi:hypothetical protein
MCSASAYWMYCSVFYCSLRWLMFLLIWCCFLQFGHGFRRAQQGDLEEWGDHEWKDGSDAHSLFGELTATWSSLFSVFPRNFLCNLFIAVIVWTMEFGESVYARGFFQLLGWSELCNLFCELGCGFSSCLHMYTSIMQICYQRCLFPALNHLYFQLAVEIFRICFLYMACRPHHGRKQWHRL